MVLTFPLTTPTLLTHPLSTKGVGRVNVVNQKMNIGSEPHHSGSSVFITVPATIPPKPDPLQRIYSMSGCMGRTFSGCSGTLDEMLSTRKGLPQTLHFILY
jgi:hypothetical protein